VAVVVFVVVALACHSEQGGLGVAFVRVAVCTNVIGLAGLTPAAGRVFGAYRHCFPSMVGDSRKPHMCVRVGYLLNGYEGIF
jgi:hypothetical protein